MRQALAASEDDADARMREQEEAAMAEDERELAADVRVSENPDNGACAHC